MGNYAAVLKYLSVFVLMSDRNDKHSPTGVFPKYVHTKKTPIQTRCDLSNWFDSNTVVGRGLVIFPV